MDIILQAIGTFVAIILGGFTIYWAFKILIRDSYEGFIIERREILLKASENDRTIDWMLEKRLGIEGIQEDEKKLYFLSLIQLSHYEHIYYRKSKGLFPIELWKQWHDSLEGSFNDPVFKRIWASDFKKFVWPKFVEYVDRGFKDQKEFFSIWRRE